MLNWCLFQQILPYQIVVIDELSMCSTSILSIKLYILIVANSIHMQILLVTTHAKFLFVSTRPTLSNCCERWMRRFFLMSILSKQVYFLRWRYSHLLKIKGITPKQIIQFPKYFWCNVFAQNINSNFMAEESRNV